MGEPFNLSNTDLWTVWQMALNSQADFLPCALPVLPIPTWSDCAVPADISSNTWAFVEAEWSFLTPRTE